MLMPQAALAEASARDDLRPAHAALAQAFARSRAGEVGSALADLEDARERFWDGLDDLHRAALLTTVVDCRLARGELDAAHADGDALRPMLQRPGPVGASAHFARGELAGATGDAQAAFGHYARVGALIRLDDPSLLPWRAAAALAAVRLGRRTEAVELAREHLALAREAGSAYAVAQGLRALAAVDVHADRARTLREARSALPASPPSRLAAQIDTDLAGLLLLSARPGGGRDEHAREALRLLRAAEAYAGREELWPLLGRVRRLLDRMGEPARLVLGEALAALTAAERRVARLAATGVTNREIASELVVTVKAVEWHLSRIYRKLGIRSRDALAGSLGTA